jgi:hypothetical protein
MSLDNTLNNRSSILSQNIESKSSDQALAGTPPSYSRGDAEMIFFEGESRKRANANGTKVNNAFTQFLQANGTVVNFRDRELKLPHDYKYDDAKPEEAVASHVLWGEVPQEARSLDGRAQFAAWLTSSDNPQFARTIANRMWKLCFGVGLVEPIDDFRPDNLPSHPELMDHLAAEMLRLDFDLREFVRIVVSTEAWQRRAIPYDATTGEAFSFAAPSLRRQSAEQLWDSILTLVAHDPWAYERPTDRKSVV